MSQDRRFAFVGVDASGNEKKGIIEADSEEAATALLESSGVSVRAIKENVRRRPSAKVDVETVSADPSSAELASKEPIRVKVVDFDMNIVTMMLFMIKWAFASIPAAIILYIIAFFFIALFGPRISP